MSKLNSLLIPILLFVFFHGNAQQIDVLTYNIRYASFDSIPQNWDQRREGVIAIFKGHDFIGLQEVMPVQMTYISEIFKDEYGFLYRTREADSTKGEGCPVIFNKSRWEVLNRGHFWLSGTPDIPGSNTWGAAYNRLVTFGLFREFVSGDSVLVINTHFDHISQSARENSVRLILEKFRKSISEYPVIIMGDLNIIPDNPAYLNILSGTSLSDSYHVVHSSETVMGATFHGWKSEIPKDRIDYIFISPMIQVESSQVLHNQFNGRYPSDHFPLNSILSLKKYRE
jgi:endonuclease/exonuclease/phosphatase family metal-dependent hydrolase